MWKRRKKSKVYFFGELLAAFLRDANILFPLASTDVHVAHAYLSCPDFHGYSTSRSVSSRVRAAPGENKTSSAVL